MFSVYAEEIEVLDTHSLSSLLFWKKDTFPFRINGSALRAPNTFPTHKSSHRFINPSLQFIFCGPFPEQRRHPLTPSWVAYYIAGYIPMLQVRKYYLTIIDIVMANVLISIIIKILVTRLSLLFPFHLDNKMGQLVIPKTYSLNR